MTFRPRLNSKSKAIARTMGRDGTKVLMTSPPLVYSLSALRVNLQEAQEILHFLKKTPILDVFFLPAFVFGSVLLRGLQKKGGAVRCC